MAASDCRPDTSARFTAAQGTVRPSRRFTYTQSQLRRAIQANDPMPSVEVADMLHTIADKGLDLDARKDVWPFLLGVYSLDSTSVYQSERLQQLQQQYTDLLTSCQHKETQLLELAVPSPDSKERDSQPDMDTQTTAPEHTPDIQHDANTEYSTKHNLQLQPVQDNEDLVADELSPILFVQKQYNSWSPKTDTHNVTDKQKQSTVALACGTASEQITGVVVEDVQSNSCNQSQLADKDSPAVVVVHIEQNTQSEHSNQVVKAMQHLNNVLAPLPGLHNQCVGEDHSTQNGVVPLQEHQDHHGVSELHNTDMHVDTTDKHGDAMTTTPGSNCKAIQTGHAPTHSCLTVTAASPQLSHRKSNLGSGTTTPVCRLSESKTSSAYVGSVSPLKMPSSARHVRVASDHSPMLHPSGNDGLFVHHTRLHSRTLSGQFDLTQDLGHLGLTAGATATSHHSLRLGSTSPFASVHHSRCPSHVDAIASPLAPPSVTQDVTATAPTPMSDIATHEQMTDMHAAESCQEQQPGPQTPGVAAHCHMSIGGSPIATPLPQELHDFWEAQRLIVVDAIRTDFQKHSLTATDMVSSWLSAAIADTGLYQKIKSSDATWAEGAWLSGLARSQLEHVTHLTNEQKRQVVRLIQLLSAYSVHDPEIGYCQGMSDLALPFLLICDDDAMAFWLFERLMSKARCNFTIDDAGILGQLATLMQVIEKEDPVLFQKLNEVGVADGHFAYRMIVVLMRRELPLDQALRLWEMVWADELLEANPHYKALQLSRTQSAPLSASKQALGLRRSFPRLLLLRASDIGEPGGADPPSVTTSIADSATATPSGAAVAFPAVPPTTVSEQLFSASSQQPEAPKWWQTTLDSFRTSFSKPVSSNVPPDNTPSKPDVVKSNSDVEDALVCSVGVTKQEEVSTKPAILQKTSASEPPQVVCLQLQKQQSTQPPVSMFAGSSLFAKLKSFSSKPLLPSTSTAASTHATTDQAPESHQTDPIEQTNSKPLDIAAVRSSSDGGADCTAIAREPSKALSEAEAEAQQWGKLVTEDSSDSKPRPFAGMLAKLSSLFSAPSVDLSSAGSATAISAEVFVQDSNLNQKPAQDSKQGVDACEAETDAASQLCDQQQQQQQAREPGAKMQEICGAAHKMCVEGASCANADMADYTVKVASDASQVAEAHRDPDSGIAGLDVDPPSCDCSTVLIPNASSVTPTDLLDSTAAAVQSSLPDTLSGNGEMKGLDTQKHRMEGQAKASVCKQVEPSMDAAATATTEVQPAALDAQSEPVPGLFLLVVASVIVSSHERIISSCHGAEDVMTLFQNLATQKINIDDCVRKAREIRSQWRVKKSGQPSSPIRSPPVSPSLL